MGNGISTIVIDCDGCLTDGGKWVGGDGQRQVISFHSRDNTAIQRLIQQGYRVVIVTASHFPGIGRYWRRYGVEVFTSREKHLLPDIEWSCALGVGDDIMDAPFLRQCAAAFVPADAHPELVAEFDTLRTPGGAGIMAEVESKINNLFFSENGAKYMYNGSTN